ncbi:AcrR family transcriptional regulator [Caldalkalibacillus uzonensis]|uniref:AcrR family transcriptional regulator n=1 Tax=Caldalkalibacillus uzonensis TaxID=353224 RepID=A0ABU0CXN7_9BACI|nr:TetR/AcrR family transcriptional regulator [Caldalkalibacillus uzonensis]MDQ0340502.1 AcrR family transcriptional regulator [Caldalkalibacillus uzonensis]
MITKTFSQLEPSKQQRIINAALAEFAEHGYEQASTNRIVREAGIGKGMLFYYFNSKKELYHYLVDYCLDYVVNEYLNLIDERESDFIERYKQAAQIKMKVYTENPHVFHFLGNIWLNQEVELPADLAKRLEEIRKLGYAKIYGHVDYTLFRDDVDADKVFHIIRWAMEGYEKDLLNRLKGQKLTAIDWDPYWDEFFEFLDVFKKVFYK